MIAYLVIPINNGVINMENDLIIVGEHCEVISMFGKLILPFETSLQGVFASGDVRSGSTKRVAVAAGEGASALQQIHKYLENNK